MLESVTRVMAEEAVEAELGYMRTLIDFLWPRGREEDGDIASLLKRTGQLADGHAAVIAPDGAVTGSGRIPRIMTPNRCAVPLGRVREGELGAASVGQDGYFVQLLGIGASLPRPVLAVARETPYPSRVSHLIRRTASALAVSERLHRTERVEHELAQALPAARIAIHERLMAGDVEGARGWPSR